MQKRPRVLFLDDDPSYRQIIGAALRTFEIDIRDACSGEEGLPLLSTFEPDILLVDLHMTGMSGVEFTQRALAHDDSLLVAIVTGKGDEDSLAELLKIGASDFLRKPFALNDLRGVVSRFLWILNRREMRRFSPELLHEGSLCFELQSSSRALKPAVQAVKHFIASFLSPKELLSTVGAVQEILANALEHGNLGISSEEKRAAHAEERFEHLLEERSFEAIRDGKTILLDVQLLPGVFRCTVTDQGLGFDFARALECAKTPCKCSEVLGRGLFLITRAFDEVSFSDSGRTISVRKNLPLL